MAEPCSPLWLAYTIQRNLGLDLQISGPKKDKGSQMPAGKINFQGGEHPKVSWPSTGLLSRQDAMLEAEKFLRTCGVIFLAPPTRKKLRSALRNAGIPSGKQGRKNYLIFIRGVGTLLADGAAPQSIADAAARRFNIQSYFRSAGQDAEYAMERTPEELDALCAPLNVAPILTRLKETKAHRKKRRKKEWACSENFLRSYEWRILRMEILKKYGTKCMCCGATPRDGIVIHVDHIKPRKTHPDLALDPDNLQVLCEACNHGKANWDDTDWR